MATLNVVYRIGADIRSMERSMERVAGTAGRLDRAMTAVGAVASTAIAGTAVAAVTRLGVETIRSAARFESGFAGVRKTVDATEEEFQDLSDGIRQMATEIPVTTGELNRIAEAAGQLGIETGAILGFTRVMADLGVTTNMAAEEAATSLARLASIMQTPQDEFDRMGAAIVDLGNNFETTEAEIVDFGLRIAGAGKIAGLTEPQVLAIGAAMTSVGVQAEAGGTAVQKALNAMTGAVAEGGEKLEAFAEVAGLSAVDFAQAYREDAGQAFVAFVEGLGRAGDEAFAILDDLGLGNERLVRAFLSLANAGTKAGDTMRTATDAYRDNAALVAEAEERHKTFDSQVQTLISTFDDLKIELGTALLPELKQLLEIIRDGVDDLRDNEAAIAGLAQAFEGLSTVAAAAGFAFARVMDQFRQSVTVLLTMTRIAPELRSLVDWVILWEVAVGERIPRTRGHIADLEAEFSGLFPTMVSAEDAFADLLIRLGQMPPALEKAAEEVDEVTAAMTRAIPAVEGWTAADDLANLTAEDTARVARDVGASFDVFARSGRVAEEAIATLPSTNHEVSITLEDVERAAAAAGDELDDLGDDAEGLGAIFRQSLADLNDVFVAAFTGGGGLGGALRALFTNLARDLLAKIPVVGAILSQFAGAIVSGIEAVFSGFGRSTEDNLRHAATEMGLVLSDQMIETLEQQIDAGEFNDVWSAVMGNLGQVIEDMGGVAAVGVGEVIRLTRDLFSFFEMGLLTLDQVSTSFDNVFRQLLPEAVDFATGEVREDFLELIALANRFGVESEALAEFMEDVGAQLESAITERAELMAEVVRDGAAAFREFKESGVGAGVAIPPIFRPMIEAAEALEGELGTVIRGANAGGEALMALHRIGVVNQKQFTAFGGSVASAFDQLVASGMSAEGAMQALRPVLATLILLQEEHGFELDNQTQSLLDQAKEYGIVGDEAKTSTDRQIEALDRLIAVLDRVVEVFESTLPQAINSLPDPEVRIHVDTSELDNLEVPSFQHGGVMPHTGLALLHRGEQVIPAHRVEAHPGPGRDDRVSQQLDQLIAMQSDLPDQLATLFTHAAIAARVR